MISFSSIIKQYGKQLIFVEASFQLNPGGKVGLSARTGRARRHSSVWSSGRKPPTRARFRFRTSWPLATSRQDVEEMKDRSVLDGAIANIRRLRKPANGDSRGRRGGDNRQKRIPANRQMMLPSGMMAPFGITTIRSRT